MARLGEKGFESAAAAGAFVTLITLSKVWHLKSVAARGMYQPRKTPLAKAAQLLIEPLKSVVQAKQLDNPDARLSLDISLEVELLGTNAKTGTGIQTFKLSRFLSQFWEHFKIGNNYNLFVKQRWLIQLCLVDYLNV